MANTFELIASSTVGSGGAASIDFTSIPSTYTDLAVYISARTTGGAGYVDAQFRFNGSSTTYSGKSLVGSGSSAASYSEPTSGVRIDAIGNGGTTSTFTNHYVYIPNYAGSTYKSVSVDASYENNGTANQLWFIADLWSNTAAINQITYTPVGTNLAEFTTAYLYGVKNA